MKLRSTVLVMIGAIIVAVVIAAIITEACDTDGKVCRWFARDGANSITTTPIKALVPKTITESAEDETDEHRADIQFSTNGRISLRQTELPTDKRLIIALPIAAETFNDSPLPVKIVAVDGRVLNLITQKTSQHQLKQSSSEPEAKDTSDQLFANVALDPSWLTPGSYLIQLATNEKTALPIRRYVLIID